MKIAIICPASILFMPYLKNYENILKDNNIDYDIYNWDRFQDEEYPFKGKYRDNKVGHQRNFFDYIKYKKFLIESLKNTKYDKLIIFGIQLSYFLKKFLIENYRNNFIIDIRDYNRIIKYYKIEKLVECSNFVAISSPGFKKWLPKSNKYIVSHNTTLIEVPRINKNYHVKKNINISYIGTIRDLDVNLKFIDSIKNERKFQMFYHGEGIINQDLIKFKERKEIKNLYITGKYFKKEEDKLYTNADLVNILIPYEDINNKSLLPNRLYQATERGVPLLTLKGSYTAEIVAKYKIGLVLNSLTNIGISFEIEDYFNNFNLDLYDKGRKDFLNIVIKENTLFETKLLYFLNK